jgi:ribosomal protein L22
MIGKVVRSALANATQKAGLEGEDLVVWRAFVDGGPIAKRWRPRAMGRGYPRFRRTCHLSVVLKQVARKAPRKKGSAPGSEPASPHRSTPTASPPSGT